MYDSKYCKITLEHGTIHCLPVHHDDGRITYDGPYTIIAAIENSFFEEEFFDVITGEKIYVWPFSYDEYIIDNKPNILVGNKVQMLLKSEKSSVIKELKCFRDPTVMTLYLDELDRIKQNRMVSIQNAKYIEQGEINPKNKK